MPSLLEFLQFLAEKPEPPFQQVPLFFQPLHVLLPRGEGRSLLFLPMSVTVRMAGAVMPP